MSYDVTLKIQTGPDQWFIVYDINMTSNVAPVWRTAGIHLEDFDGKPVLELVEAINDALPNIMRSPESFEPLVRGGGEWGTVDSAIHFLTMLKLHGEKHQYTTVSVCH